MNTQERQLDFHTQMSQTPVAPLIVRDSGELAPVVKRGGRYKTYENYRTSGYSLWHKTKTAARNLFWRLTLRQGRWYKVRLESGSRVFYFWNGSNFQTRTRDLKDHYHIVQILDVLDDWYQDAEVADGD